MVLKKIGFCLMFFILITILCFAQSNNDEQRIVGTWSGTFRNTNIAYTFNSNGTVTYRLGSTVSNGNYFINGIKMIIRLGSEAMIFEYYLSPNGRVLVFAQGHMQGYDAIWLEKQ
jgi:hypothetical protein